VMGILPSAPKMLARLPLVAGRGQLFDDLPQFLRRLCPKARHHSIEQYDEGNSECAGLNALAVRLYGRQTGIITVFVKRRE
jgi:hypothetical protein